jgi:hypothetical protein
MQISLDGETTMEMRAQLPEHLRGKRTIQIVNHFKPMVIPGPGLLAFRLELSLDGNPVMDPFVHEIRVEYEDQPATPTAP